MPVNFSPTQTATQAATPTLLDQLLAQRNQSSNAAVGQNTGATITPMAGASPNNITVTAGHPQPFPPITPAPQVTPQVPPSITGPLTQNPPPTLPVPGDGNGPAQNPTGAIPNYDNSSAVQSLSQATAADRTPAGGYGKSQGIYGLLPQGLQHGTLRSILGSLGDAFLVHGGMQPEYKPRQDALAEGNALAGMDMTDPASVQAAVQRLAATGAPGAMEMADRVQTQANSAALQRQMQEQTNFWRQSQSNDRNQNILARQAPGAQGMVSAATNQADYASRYALLDKRAKMVDPTADASSAYAIPLPEDWSQTPGYGLTSNQQQIASDKAAGRTATTANTGTRAAATIRAAQIGAAGRTTDTNLSNQRPSQTTFEQELVNKKNLADAGKGPALTPAEQLVFNHMTQVGKGGGGAKLPAGLNPGGGGGGGQFHEGVVYTDKNGNRAKYSNGKFVPL